MADDYGIQGLNGTEIINDLVAQFRKRLEGDCNLRPHDAYSRGYSAKITSHIELYGLDTTPVDMEFEVGTQQDPDAEVIDETLEIPQEEDLVYVRDRIKSATDGPPESEDDSPEPVNATDVKAKRRYTRKVQQLASPGVIGGTEEFKE